MTKVQPVLTEKAWSECKWEFYKDVEGLWQWRATAPESWCHKNGINGHKQSAHGVTTNSWKGEGAHGGGGHGGGHGGKGGGEKAGEWHGEEWVEIARSEKGYHSRGECEANAKKWGWK